VIAVLTPVWILTEASSTRISEQWVKGLRNDLIGGLVSAAVAIPLALAFGMFVFVTLGDAYFFQGARAGLIAAFGAGVVCVVLGESSYTIYAPRIPTTFFLGSLLYSLVHSTEPGLAGAPASFTLLVLFAIMMLAGLLEAFFGLLRLGTLIKFAPHPVMAGFRNMAAALLFLVQLGNVLGYEHNVPFTRAIGQLADAKPLSVAIAAITFAAMWHARRMAAGVPPLLVGLGIGIAAYYSLVMVGLAAALGPVIGMPSGDTVIPVPYVELIDPALIVRIAHLAHIIVPGALALALISAIDAMLCAKLVSPPGSHGSDSNRILVRLGLANAAATAAGGITSGINIGSSVTNRSFGGRSPVSVAVNAALVLVTISFGMPIVGHLPRVVLSALIMVVAVQHLDPWSTQTTIRLFKEGIAGKSALALDLGVAMLVSLLSIAINIVLAVFLGLAIAMSLFVLRMSRSNIRRLYRCDTMRSRKARTPGEMKILEERGSLILVIELQGAIFFGSAERLAKIIDVETGRATKTLILDLRRVTEIDSTGAQILMEIEADCARNGIALIFVLRDRGEILESLAGLTGRRMPDVDRGIEHAEDNLLAALDKPREGPADLSLEGVSLLRELTADQIARLRPYVESKEWAAGSTIFSEGDPGSDMFFVSRGHASVRLVSNDRHIRLATFGPGTVFGELAILDHGPRSATVTADDALTVFALGGTSFVALQSQEPDIAIKILSALSHELSSRLRQANMTIHQLEV
jgi:sulfate permease, SulP family